ncbi:MAG: lipid-A-disaccharide synthase [Magnetococcales bacterium]|nr:lipid-A-disaccharide synthase [Magnetococcales bacterium]
MKLMIVAGESSGDYLGANLISGLQARFNGLEIIGMGGPKMAAAGLHSPFDVNDISVIGLAEVIKRLPRIIRVFNHLKNQLKKEKPTLLVTIDLPDFNLRLAKEARKLGIPVVHYVSPQVWAWRKNRIYSIAKRVNHLLALFPFEPEMYKPTGLPVTFVGHPLVDLVKDHGDPLKVRHALSIADDAQLVTLLPGSRQSELKRLLPVMVASAERIHQKHGHVRFVLAQADTVTLADLDHAAGAAGLPDWIEPIGHKTYDLLGASDAALVASGTATLETALIQTPMVVIYRVNAITYQIGLRIVKIPFFSLANLVAGKQVVPERLQHEANPEMIAEDLLNILESKEKSQEIRNNLQAVTQQLSNPQRTAVDVVSDWLDGTLSVVSGG